MYDNILPGIYIYSHMLNRTSMLLCVLVALGAFVYTSRKQHSHVADAKTPIIRTLYRQAARWAVASAQDDSEIIRVLHANYATGYLWALKDIASTDEFLAATGQEFLAFERSVVRVQDDATRRLVARCQGVLPKVDPALLRAVYSA